MKILVSIETTGVNLGISVFKWSAEAKTAEKIFTHFVHVGHRQSELLVPTLETILKKIKRTKKDIGLVAVDVGPGSFTGVRIGVSLARALGQALHIPVVGVSSLEALAENAAKKNSVKPVGIVVSLLALEGELYAAAYLKNPQEKELEVLLSPCWMTEKEWTQTLRKLKARRSGLSWVQAEGNPHSEDVAQVAVRQFRAQKKSVAFDYNFVQPLYLQPSWAERKPPA